MLWAKSGNQDDLMLTPTNIEDPPSQRAVCAVVGTVSANCIFLEAHGNYNPNIKRTSLETSKAQFQIVSPDNHLEFDADFNQAITHIEAIQKKAINDGPHGEHFIISNGLKKGLRFSWPLFEKRVCNKLI